VSISGGNTLVGITTGDFNNDGNVDFAVVSWGGSKVFVLLGNGNGTFQTPTSISVVGSPVEIATADFNNDGNLDLAVVDNSGNHVEVLLGNGTGAFPATSTYSTGSSPYSIAVADLNNDGNLDMVIGNNGASSVTVLLGNGAGIFSQPTGSPFAAGTNPSPSALVIGDFNGDGKPDLAVPDSGNNAVGILLGNGDGTFGTASYLTALSGQKTIAMADFIVTRTRRDLMVAELTTLKTVRRREVANALEVARAHGDLRENAEYEAAKQEQHAHMECRRPALKSLHVAFRPAASEGSPQRWARLPSPPAPRESESPRCSNRADKSCGRG